MYKLLIYLIRFVCENMYDSKIYYITFALIIHAYSKYSWHQHCGGLITILINDPIKIYYYKSVH